jgi:hypothetical protein
MRTRQIASLFLPCAIVFLILSLGWALLPGGESAQAAQPISTQQEASIPPSTPPTPDLRWLEMVRILEGISPALEEGPPAELPASPAASLTVHLNLTDGSLAGSALSLLPVQASVTRDGYVIAAGEAMPAPAFPAYFYSLSLGWYPYPCGGGTCYPSSLEAGDEVVVTQGTTSLSASVPYLTALAEPVDDRLYGEAPPLADLLAIVSPLADPAETYTQSASAGADGSYHITLSPAHDLHRQDSGYLLVELAADAHAYRRFVAPMLRAQVGGGSISGVAAPQADIIITQTNPSGEVVGVYHDLTDQTGEFSYLTDLVEYPDPQVLSPGDRLLASAAGQVFSMTLPTLSARTDQANSQVGGQAPPGAELEGRAYQGPLGLYYIDMSPIWDLEPTQVSLTSAGPSGEYTASLALDSGDYGAVYLTLPDEHQAFTRTSTFFLFARLSNAEDTYYYGDPLSGQVDHVLTPITITVQGPSGYLKDWGVPKTTSAGSFWFAGSDPYNTWLKIDSGDVIGIATPGEGETYVTMPPLTASANRNTAIVSGITTPSSRLTVNVANEYGLFLTSQVVTSTAGGEYSADFSGSLQFNNYTWGQVILETPQGHQVSRGWRIGCPPYLNGAQVGGNRILVNVEYPCYDGKLRLWSAAGELKKVASLWETYYSTDEGPEMQLYDEFGAPIPVLPGDQIEIEYEGASVFTEVPQLSAQVDPASSLVSGSAPPGARLEIQRMPKDFSTPQPPVVVVTATQGGAYQASLGSDYRYQIGDRIIVSISRQPQKFFTLTALPRMVIQMHTNFVHGWLPPLTPYELRHSGASGLASQSFHAENDASFYAYLDQEYYTAVRIQPGDLLELETPQGVEQLTIPTLTAHYDVLAARLSGQAPPASELSVAISAQQPDGGTTSLTRQVTVTTQGEYSVDFPELEGATSAQGNLTYSSPAGHQVTLSFSTPHFEVTLSQSCVSGPMPYPGAAITLTVTSADGGYQYTDSNDSFTESFYFCLERDFTSGDRLELSSSDGILLQYTLPSLSADHVFTLPALLGSAPPGSNLQVEFYTQLYTILRRPLQEADGSFGIDTSDIPLEIGNWGRVTVQDQLGNTTHLQFYIGGPRVYLPLVIQR